MCQNDGYLQDVQVHRFGTMSEKRVELRNLIAPVRLEQIVGVKSFFCLIVDGRNFIEVAGHFSVWLFQILVTEIGFLFVIPSADS
jgi:hypothetical protein